VQKPWILVNHNSKVHPNWIYLYDEINKVLNEETLKHRRPNRRIWGR